MAVVESWGLIGYVQHKFLKARRLSCGTSQGYACVKACGASQQSRSLGWNAD